MFSTKPIGNKQKKEPKIDPDVNLQHKSYHYKEMKAVMLHFDLSTIHIPSINCHILWMQIHTSFPPTKRSYMPVAEKNSTNKTYKGYFVLTNGLSNVEMVLKCKRIQTLCTLEVSNVNIITCLS